MIEIVNIKQAGHPVYPYDFYIDRRSPVGNPFHMKDESKRDYVCDAYMDYFSKMVECGSHEFVSYLDMMIKAHNTYGKLRLFCWCAPKRCHGYTIWRYLDSKVTYRTITCDCGEINKICNSKNIFCEKCGTYLG